MGKQINEYVKVRTALTITDDDLLDFDSTEDGGGTFESAKITVAQFMAFVNAGVINLYNADGTLLSNRIVTSATFWTQFLGGDVEVKMDDEISEYAFIVRDSSDTKLAIMGYDIATTSGDLQVHDGGGLFFQAKNSQVDIDGAVNCLGGTSVNLVSGNITWTFGGFTGTLSHIVQTGNHAWNFPDDSGTVALVHDQDVGNSLFVSSKGRTIANGAVRESLSRHFSSMSEALSVAVSGDTIFVYGDQTPNANLWKDGITWHFFGNSTITNNQYFFADGGVAGTCVIKGDAIFSSTAGGCNLSGTGTQIYLECHTITTVSGVACQFIGTDAVVNVSELIHSSNGATIYVDLDADVIVNTKNITGTKFNGLCVNVRAPFTGQLVINAEKITATPTQAGSMVCYWAQVGATGKTVINVSDKIQLLGTALTCQALLTGAGSCCINGDVDGAHGNAFGIEQTPENVTHNGNAINDGTHPLIDISGSDVCNVWLNGVYESSNANVIVQNNVNSTLNINGRIVNTNALAVSKSGVLVSNGLATIFQNVVIILDGALGTPVCIGASAPKNVKVFHHIGTNFIEDGNITNTITGTNITVDTDYQ